MSYLQYNIKHVPSGISKLLYVNWAIVLLLCAVVGMGLVQLYSIAGGSVSPWLSPQATRFGLGMVVMFIVAMIPIVFWRKISMLAYIGSLGLLLAVEFFGTVDRNDADTVIGLVGYKVVGHGCLFDYAQFHSM